MNKGAKGKKEMIGTISGHDDHHHTSSDSNEEGEDLIFETELEHMGLDLIKK